MALTTQTPPGLLRAVMTDYLGACQAIAALDDRIAWIRGLSNPDEDTCEASMAAHRMVVALRETWDIMPMTEAALDAAHEASLAEFAELADAEALPDVPLAVRRG